MATTITVTNQTDAELNIDEIYTLLGPNGAANDAVTFTRSMAQLDSMPALQALAVAGSVSISVTEGTANLQVLSIPVVQHGNQGTLAVDAIAVVTHAITFPTAFPTGVVPEIRLGIQRNTHTDWKAQVYAQAVTATGFTIALDVTVASGTSGEKGNVTWQAIY